MNNNRCVALLMEDCVQVDDKLYFIAKDMNIVCFLDINTGKVQIVDSIPEEHVLASRLGAKIIHWRNELIFAPMNAKKIWIYNLDTKKWHGIGRKKVENPKVSGAMFQAVLHEDKLFIIGSDYPAIICLDLLAERVVYIEEPYKRLKKIKEKIGDAYFRCHYVQIGTKIYLASCLDNSVLEFDMETLDYRWITVGNCKNRYSGIAWDGQNFWLAPRINTAIVRWDGKQSSVEYALPKKFVAEKLYFLGVVYDGEKIVCPGMLMPFTIEFTDLQEGEWKLITKQYSFYGQVGPQLIVGQTLDGTMELHYLDSESVVHKCKIEKSEIRKYINNKNVDLERYFSNGQHNENNILGLPELCRGDGEKEGIDLVNIKGNNGRKIWEKLRN